MTRYHHNIVDREGWGSGAWDGEPDKVEWGHAGLPCIALRGPFGSWCGYVGVSKDHPLYGIGASDVADLPTDLLADLLESRVSFDLYEDDLHEGKVRLEAILTVHGGVTYANSPSEITPTTWKKYANLLINSKHEATQYPKGDAAQRIKEWGPVIGDYEAWAERSRQRGIWHADAPDAWWIGFDCSHAGDCSPGMDAALRGLGSSRQNNDVYRPIAYVQAEVEDLAEQLKEIAELTK